MEAQRSDAKVILTVQLVNNNKINTVTSIVLFYIGKSCAVCLPEILKSSVFHSPTVRGNFLLTLKYGVYFLLCLKKNYDSTMFPSFSLKDFFF